MKLQTFSYMGIFLWGKDLYVAFIIKSDCDPKMVMKPVLRGLFGNLEWT